MRIVRNPWILITLTLLSVSCERSKAPETASAKPVVAVSIPPQLYFVERIAGDHAKVLVLVDEGQSPHAYEPTPRQMAELATASLWILSGTDFEHGLRPKVEALYPTLPLVDATEGISFREIEAHEEEAGEAGHEAEESGRDPHTWLGREAALFQAIHIKDALARIDPAAAEVYEQNYLMLVSDIEAVFDELRERLATLRGRSVFVYHPAFGYFLDVFGLRQVSVETGGKEPTAKGLAALVALAMQEKPAAIFVQAQFPVEAAKTLADSVGASVVALDPLAPDWLGNIRRMGEALEEAFSGVQVLP